MTDYLFWQDKEIRFDCSNRYLEIQEGEKFID